MTWRLARSLAVLRDEVNARAPMRSKTSDGTLGDQAHAARQSDHNPNSAGVVCAIDITDDPAHGHDDRVFAEHIRKLGAAGDKRVKYVISNGRIAGPSTRGWAWRPYTGANPHDKHTHLSVSADATHYDSQAPWGWHVATAPKPPPAPKPPEEDDDMARLVRDTEGRIYKVAGNTRAYINEGATIAWLQGHDHVPDSIEDIPTAVLRDAYPIEATDPQADVA